MQLTKHIEQGSILFFTKSTDAISISENTHYRWLAFNDVIQSVMLKRKPYQLTLPHQIAMMLPLLFFRPDKVVELGLGGGNLGRYLTNLNSKISFSSIECNQTVIDCFQRYFNPQKSPLSITNSRSENWLKQQDSLKIDWLICDIYQDQLINFKLVIDHFELLAATISPTTCLSINLSDSTDEEVNLCLTLLQQLFTTHQITYFHIPNYLNIVVQIMPNHWNVFRSLKRNVYSYLPNRTFLHWRKFWPNGIKLTKNK